MDNPSQADQCLSPNCFHLLLAYDLALNAMEPCIEWCQRSNISGVVRLLLKQKFDPPSPLLKLGHFLFVVEIGFGRNEGAEMLCAFLLHLAKSPYQEIAVRDEIGVVKQCSLSLFLGNPRLWPIENVQTPRCSVADPKGKSVHL